MWKAFFFKALFFFFYRILFRKFRGLHRNVSITRTTPRKYQKYHSLAKRSDLSDKTMVFNMEGALLRSSSLFPYFMLVAFEAGSILRAFFLFLLYPFVCLVSEEMGLKIMVMVCFFGVKKDGFRVGSAVLPKFFLEEVGLDLFQVLKRGGKIVGVSDLPQVMIESFLRDYLEVDYVCGRELKVFHGYFVGLMEEENDYLLALKKIQGEENICSNLIGISSYHKCFDHQLSLLCKEIYLVNEAEKSRWRNLPTHKYPNPLIFHDGRLAFIPTPLATLSLFMWLPFGFILALIRTLVALLLPYNIFIPFDAFTGMHLTVSHPHNTFLSPHHVPTKGLLYVCNHRTLLDPLYLSFILRKKPTAVTYSLSRMSEILSPIRTLRLTRDRDRDSKMMEELLSQGDVVVCPEGTTCREPFLLRFSPLFSELSADIVPVANDTHVSLFYGTTASGLKCLDPLFFMMNPSPTYTVRFLEKVYGLSPCGDDAGRSRFDAANHVQREIAKALDFECTKLTRRDKYLILAGNEGIVCPSPKP